MRVACDSHHPAPPAARLCVHLYSLVYVQVRDNVDAVLQGLGLVPSPQQEQEAAALAAVEQILAPVQGLTWPSGLAENN